MAEGSNILYALDRGEQLIVQPLDTMTVIYQRRSGMTHMVADPVPQILSMMDATPQTAQDIAHRLAGAFEFAENASAAAEIVAARLEEMAALGLLERTGA